MALDKIFGNGVSLEELKISLSSINNILLSFKTPLIQEKTFSFIFFFIIQKPKSNFI